MRVTTPVLLLLLLAPAAHAADAFVTYPDDVGDTVAVDLVDDAGDQIHWRLDTNAARQPGGCLEVPDGDPAINARTATATLSDTGSSERVEIALQRNVEYHEDPAGNTVFRGSLDVDDPDLRVATWSLGLVVRDDRGVDHDCGDERELAVTADDSEPPVVAFPSAEDNVIELGAGQAVAATVTDATLGIVEFRVDRMPDGLFHRLGAPFIISSTSFFAGDNELTVRASDRAGNGVTEETVTVRVDGDDPKISVDLRNRTTFFSGTEAPIDVTVEDASSYRITARFQDVDVQVTGAGGEAETHVLRIPANQTGNAQLFVRVVDAFGNTATSNHAITVGRLRTDARLVDAEQDEERVIVGEDVDIHVTMEQEDGLIPVVFALRLDGGEMGDMEVPADGTNETVLTTRLPPGRQSLRLQALAPEGVLSNPKNLTLDVPVEVYLARVLVDDDAFHVRAGADGLPSGVVAPNGTVLSVELRELSGSSVYTFEADGETYFWDPDGGREQTYKEPESTQESEESPGPAVVLVLAVLALAVALRRR